MKERKALQTTKMRYLDKLLFFSFKKLANYPFQVFVDHSQLMIVFTYNTASIKNILMDSYVSAESAPVILNAQKELLQPLPERQRERQKINRTFSRT